MKSQQQKQKMFILPDCLESRFPGIHPLSASVFFLFVSVCPLICYQNLMEAERGLKLEGLEIEGPSSPLPPHYR